MAATTDDHRFAYSPADLLAVGQRMTDDYGPDDALADYMELHPDADRDAVRAEIQRLEAPLVEPGPQE